MWAVVAALPLIGDGVDPPVERDAVDAVSEVWDGVSAGLGVEDVDGLLGGDRAGVVPCRVTWGADDLLDLVGWYEVGHGVLPL